MFKAGDSLSLEEFADAREVVADLSAEYEACEHADYVSGAGGAYWGWEGQGRHGVGVAGR